MSYLAANAETPRQIDEIDASAVHLGPDGARPINVDGYAMLAEIIGLGADEKGGACPACSFHFEGRCHWCPDDAAASADIPECAGCDGRSPPPAPWYTKSEIIIPVVTAVVVTVLGTVLSAIVLTRMGHKEA